MKNLNHCTDEELVKLYENGNNKAFEVLLMRYKSKVYSYIYLIVRSRELAEDIFQETFIKVITCIRTESYTANGKFCSWVTRIAHNLCMDTLRYNQKNNTVSADNTEFNLLNSISLCDKNVEDNLIEEQTFNEIERLVNMLPTNQQEIIKMRFYNDCSFKDIAEKTGVSINTSLGRMRYALLNMRKLAEENNITLSF